MHYHPWCDDCQTLMEWEQPPPIRQMSAQSIPTFGDLKWPCGRNPTTGPFSGGQTHHKRPSRRSSRCGEKSSSQGRLPNEAPCYDSGHVSFLPLHSITFHYVPPP